MRIGYNENGDLRMCADNEYEFEIMDRIRKEVFGYKLTFNYEHY